MTSTLVTTAVHDAYPHIPGGLYGCLACEVTCNCEADLNRVPALGDTCVYQADSRFSGHFDPKRGSWFVWDADNNKQVGDGKGEVLTLGSQESADDIARQMTERVAQLPKDSEREEVTDMAAWLKSLDDDGYDQDDHAGSGPVRGLFG